MSQPVHNRQWNTHVQSLVEQNDSFCLYLSVTFLDDGQTLFLLISFILWPHHLQVTLHMLYSFPTQMSFLLWRLWFESAFQKFIMSPFCYSTLRSYSFSLLSYHCITSRSLTTAVVRWPISPFMDYLPFLAHACLIRRSFFILVLALNLSQFLYKYSLLYYVVTYFNLTGIYLITRSPSSKPSKLSCLNRYLT
jgi:hypothetical protein